MTGGELLFAFLAMIFGIGLVWLNIRLERPDDGDIWEEWWYDDNDEL